jgi:hypothetical protein
VCAVVIVAPGRHRGSSVKEFTKAPPTGDKPCNTPPDMTLHIFAAF